ncbi:protein EVI2B-like [Pristis pectinata]|uniref:protein EVI2B-like n=1 Tax=Pristis pectinata TaxID=685728 RepID=UPI00223CA141|nr:protein EVI2B-like [Pristis pectinata]XP_051891154.1 protein EVI2B-like [Pristis pectinata]
MEAIQLTILALLVNGLKGSNTTDHESAAGLSPTIVTASSSLQDSSTPISPTFWTTTSMSNTSRLPNELSNSTSDLMNTSSTTSQMIVSSEPSISSSAPQSTSTIKFATTPPVMSKSTTRKQTTNNHDSSLNASMIIACIIGALLLLLVVSIIAILLVKRFLGPNTVQDVSWAGTCPGPTGEDPEQIVEGCDLSPAPAKRPSLTTFLSRKSKRDSLLDQYNMEVQEAEGINNLASTETEEKTLSEVKNDNETEKEPLTLTKTPSQEFPPLLEEQAPPNEGDQQAQPPAMDTETSRLTQGVPDAVSTTDDFPPPPMDILDLVNDSDLPPPL